MRDLRLYLVAALTLALGGCDAIGSIFRVGMWAGVVMVVLVVAAIWLLVSLIR